MDEYEHKNLTARADNLLDEGKEIKTETIEVIDGINAFHCGDIVKLIYSCSDGLAGVYTSPGNREMSHDEKRIMAEGMVNKCIEDILEVSQLGLTHTADSTAMNILNEQALNLNDASLSHDGLARVLKHYSLDIKNLADYIKNSRDLNINGDSDLGDTPVYEA